MDDKSEQDDCSYDTEAVQDSSENASQQLVIGNCTFPSEIYTNTETNDDRFGEVDLSALMIKGDETQQHPNSCKQQWHCLIVMALCCCYQCQLYAYTCII